MRTEHGEWTIFTHRIQERLVSVQAEKTVCLGLGCVPNPKNERLYCTESEYAATVKYIKQEGWHNDGKGTAH